MIDKKKCCARIYAGLNGYQCRNNATIDRFGKVYCRIHDPVRIKEKIEARNKKWDKEFADKEAKQLAAEEKQQALERDAARYRFLREDENSDSFIYYKEVATWQDPYLLQGKRLDDAIDAAITKEQSKKPT